MCSILNTLNVYEREFEFRKITMCNLLWFDTAAAFTNIYIYLHNDTVYNSDIKFCVGIYMQQFNMDFNSY